MCHKELEVHDTRVEPLQIRQHLVLRADGSLALVPWYRNDVRFFDLKYFRVIPEEAYRMQGHVRLRLRVKQLFAQGL